MTLPDQRDYAAGGYRDGNGNPYWPGVNPYPPDGGVYQHGRPLTLDAAGVPIGGMAQVQAAQTAGPRG